MVEPEESSFYLETLKNITTCPTAPFHEHRVLAYISAFLKETGIPFQKDRWGNIIAHYQKGAGIRPLALMAHTDHPAFELVAPDVSPEFAATKPGANWTAKLQGGVPATCFENEVPVRVYPADETNPPSKGKVVGYHQGEKGPRDIDLYLQLENDGNLLPGNFGVWDITDFELSETHIHARAIDDLVGSAAMLLTLWKLAQQKADANLYCVFTRAEEVGLVGADVVFHSGALPKETLVVSIEASKALPGAVQGGGPVIRAGDRAFTFDDEAEFILKRAASSLGGDISARGPQSTKIQRQLMTGGRCEAGSAIVNGYKATGLAFPLGNYHNVSDATGNTLEPENIHRQDYITGVALLQKAALLMPFMDELEAEFLAKETVNQELAARLEATAD